MTTFLLVRHGQTDWNAERRYQGWGDVPLNTLGLEQAGQAAEELVGKQIDVIYCSPLKRAAQTAQVIGEKLGLSIHTDDRLKEIGMGEWEGKLVSDIQQDYPKIWEERNEMLEVPWAPGGESVIAVLNRAIAAADDISRRHPDETVLLVSHGLTLTALFCHANQFALGKMWDHHFHNGQVKQITWESTTESA